MSEPAAPASVIPGRYDPKIARVFRIIARRMIGKSFHALRFTPGSLDRLDALATHDGPVVGCMTHAGWWDPMLGVLLHIERFGPHGRDGIAPIDKAVLENVGIFKKLGLFGIDPDDPNSKQALAEYAIDRLRTMHRPTLWITPQGRFQDPRAEMEIRPGVSAILSKLDNARAIVLAVEYPFWDDKKPEMLAHIVEIEPPARTDSTVAWHRSVSSAMKTTAGELACEAVTRDPARFESSLGGEAGDGGKTFFVYDWWLKVTGRSTQDIRTRKVEA
ncbi:MAG: lysophospholipid acyltransferase family protein [Planctomycetota bacterium]